MTNHLSENQEGRELNWELEDITFDEDDFVVFVAEADEVTEQLRKEAREIRQTWEIDEPAPPSDWLETNRDDDIGALDHDLLMEIRQEAARLIRSATATADPGPLAPEIIAFAERALSR